MLVDVFAVVISLMILSIPIVLVALIVYGIVTKKIRPMPQEELDKKINEMSEELDEGINDSSIEDRGGGLTGFGYDYYAGDI